LPGFSVGQQFYRVKADFSIKEKNPEGSFNLTVGKVYYDKNLRKLIYDVTFPEPETWVIYDTLVYKIKNQLIESKTKTASLVEHSIFHLALSGNLNDFGMKETPYELKSVEKADSLIIATYQPDSRLNKLLGKVVLSKKRRKIFGIAFYKPSGELAGKQIFEQYSNYKGCDFPGEIIQFNYTPQGEKIQITTFRNVIINQPDESHLYDYNLFIIPANYGPGKRR
jgi:hypothetical protein